MLYFEKISPELTARMEKDSLAPMDPDPAFPNESVVRRREISRDIPSIWRPAFGHDIDKILNCPYYNRYADKTQVFSLFKNDDVSRRSLHVQLVSRIARVLGSALHLNLDLIEAISLGHDIGHPPFAHTGETYLNQLYHAHTGRYFSHNIHSVRVLDRIFPLNISLQVLDGIAAHNGEVELQCCRPEPLTSFEDFDCRIRGCYEQAGYANRIQPSTLEGAVVRISDLIAYIGKDRQDAQRIGVTEESRFSNTCIGRINAEIINNLVVNILENSYGKPYIAMDTQHYQALKLAKKENYEKIYLSAGTTAGLKDTVKPMMAEIYGQLLEDLQRGNRLSPIYTHHIDYVCGSHYARPVPYDWEDPNDLVTDYIASMTDDYFVDLHHYLFPDSPLKVCYRGYFDEKAMEEKENV